jgi:hypothetical protein
MLYKKQSRINKRDVIVTTATLIKQPDITDYPYK